MVHGVERAKTAKAKCQICRNKMPKGELRFFEKYALGSHPHIRGVLDPCCGGRYEHWSGGQQSRYFHPDCVDVANGCIFKKGAKFGYKELPPEQQEVVTQVSTTIPKASSLPGLCCSHRAVFSFFLAVLQLLGKELVEKVSTPHARPPPKSQHPYATDPPPPLVGLQKPRTVSTNLVGRAKKKRQRLDPCLEPPAAAAGYHNAAGTKARVKLPDGWSAVRTKHTRLQSFCRPLI